MKVRFSASNGTFTVYRIVNRHAIQIERKEFVFDLERCKYFQFAMTHHSFRATLKKEFCTEGEEEWWIDGFSVARFYLMLEEAL